MDPFLIPIVLTSLAALVASWKAVQSHRRQEQAQKLRALCLRKWPVPGQYASLADVFWDLGASDWALEMLGHQGLLPEGRDAAREARFLEFTLGERVAQAGSYGAFVDEALEAIGEYDREHRRLQDRWQTARLVPLSGEDGPAGPETTALVPWRDPSQGGPLVLGARSAQGGELPGMGGAGSLGEWEAVEQAAAMSGFEVGQWLSSLFQGGLSAQWDRWWKTRRLRGLRGELDRELEQLFRFYAAAVERAPTIQATLWQGPERWRQEAERLEALAGERPWKKRPWALAADTLVQLAQGYAQGTSVESRENVAQTLGQLEALGRAGRHARAGYLVYLNRHALMAGRVADYARPCQRVEQATARIQQEIARLEREGG